MEGSVGYGPWNYRRVLRSAMQDWAKGVKLVTIDMLKYVLGMCWVFVTQLKAYIGGLPSLPVVL